MFDSMQISFVKINELRLFHFGFLFYFDSSSLRRNRIICVNEWVLFCFDGGKRCIFAGVKQTIG